MFIPPEEKNKFLQKLYRLFNIRLRSEKEIIDYLKFKKKIENGELIDDLINTLKDQRLIDDLSFAKSWVLSRSRKLGPKVIKIELLQKGISKEIIDRVMGLAVDEEKVAEELLNKKVKGWRNLKPMEFRKKAYDFLLRRGFEYNIVKDIVEKYIKKEYN